MMDSPILANVEWKNR